MYRSPRARRLGAFFVAIAVSLVPINAFAAAEVIISEIHYNPDGSDETREFIELKNVGDETANLAGWAFNNGVIFTFPNSTSLEPGNFLVVVANSTQFALNYPGVTVAGQYINDDDDSVAGEPGLQNSGERVTLVDNFGAAVFSVRYGDGRSASPDEGTAADFARGHWPSAPDGNNHSLVGIDPDANPDPDDFRNWRPSIALHGSPGADEPLPSPLQVIYINEVRTRDDLTDNDIVELYNPGAEPVDVGDWFLSDNMNGIDLGDENPPVPADRRKRSPVPVGTVVPAGGYVVLENGVDGFSISISSRGERVFLYSADAGGNLTGWVHGLHTEASEDGLTFARFVNSAGKEQFIADLPSFGADNGDPATPSVVITEIMYSPAFGSANDYIKIKNTGAVTAPLYDVNTLETLPADANLRIGGFGMTILGSNPSLEPGEEAFVTSVEEALFRAVYSVDPAITVFSNIDGGSLSGGGEQIELRLPVTIDGESRAVPDNLESPRHYVVLDEICYDDDVPWPTGADGSGRSIVKTDATSPGSQPESWTESELRGGVVLVNEVLAHTDAPQTDVIEIYNPGPGPVDIGGWFLTDDPIANPTKYEIAAGQVVPAGGYWTINEDNDFNPNTVPPSTYFGFGFSISSRGDSIHIFSGDGTVTTGYSHGVNFRATANGVSLARHVNSAGVESFPPQSGAPSVQINAGIANPAGFANSAPRVERAVISEIFYAPGVGDVEFLEIANISGSTLALFDNSVGGNTANNWQLDGVTFTFPGIRPTIPAGGRVVIIPEGQSVAEFRTLYDVPAGVVIHGGASGYVGALNNGGEEISLLRPDNPDIVDGSIVVPLIQVDAINYENASPWPSGVGSSIERIDESAFGDEPQNWQTSHAAVGTPGRPNSTEPSYSGWAAEQFTEEELAGSGTGPGDDFNGDGYNNLHAYAFGFSPKGALPADRLPQVLTTGAGVDATLSISFRQVLVAPDLTYRVQRSTDLVEWEDIDTQVGAPVDNGDGTQTLVHADIGPILGGDGRSFLRVVVDLEVPE